MANVQSYRGISQSLPKESERQSPLVSGALSEGLTMAKGWRNSAGYVCSGCQACEPLSMKKSAEYKPWGQHDYQH